MSKRFPENGALYFIQAANGQIKIGATVNFNKRYQTLCQDTGEELAILCVLNGASKYERDYHRYFSAHRRRGEWFDPHPDILTEIERLKALLE